MENKQDVPYVIHFVFGLQEQTEPFSFVHYLSMYSAYLANDTPIIYFHHHFSIHGYWWERAQKDILNMIIMKVDVPTHIGSKQIKKVAHKADAVRMKILWEMGGIYMDIDTISYKSMKPFLTHDTTLCKQYNLRFHSKDKASVYVGGICNAIMITKPRSPFFERWMTAYERAFDPDKWEEASIWLPLRLSREYSECVNVLEPEVFNVPACWEGKKMFEDHWDDVPGSLVALHLSESMSKKYIDQITGWEWLDSHKHTLYGKLIANYRFECIISNNCYGLRYYRSKQIAYNTPFVGMYINAPCYIKLLENFDEYMKLTPKPITASKYGAIKQGSVAVLKDVEIHFWHDDDVLDAIDKWEMRKKRLYPLDQCIIKFCDRDHFEDSFVQRFDALSRYKQKKLMVSNSRHHFKKKVETTQVYRIGVDKMIDGYQLEKYVAVI